MLLIAQTLFPLCPFSKSKRGTKPHPDFLMYLKSILFVFSLGSSLGFWERDHPLLTIKYPQFPSTFVTSYSNTFVAIWETALWYSSSIWAWSLLHGLVMAFNLPPEAKRLVEWPTILCCMLSTRIIPAAIFFFPFNASSQPLQNLFGVNYKRTSAASGSRWHLLLKQWLFLENHSTVLIHTDDTEAIKCLSEMRSPNFYLKPQVISYSCQYHH